MNLNVYDFDNTIYNGDSTIDFYLFCLQKQPRIISCLFRQLRGVFLHKIHRIDTTDMKERFFSFLLKINDIDNMIDTFWNQNYKKIRSWYLKEKGKNDVIISASPDFLLEPICKNLGIPKPIATKMDKYTGKISGSNCKGNEKINRFYEKYPKETINNFYSDSKTDAPLAAIARQSYLVKGNKRYPWADKIKQQKED